KICLYFCSSGLVVLEDCVGDYSTTCIPCTKGTFMNVPNGVNTCKTCKTCGKGLYTLQNCSTIKDTVCEVLDGYYCAQHSDRECSLAMKHSVYAVKTFGALCRHGEYLSTDGECCPMCNIGLVVLRDCTGDYSTTCTPCTKGTFMNVPNRLYTCFQCKTCDRGLYTLQNCSTIKDTVWEVLDGYYCVQHSDGECSLAMKHSECKPGEQIKTPGTRVSDTVCEMCPSGFYS
ncbi:hypothetical protein C0J50_5170, partial [Silurus asotus]